MKPLDPADQDRAALDRLEALELLRSARDEMRADNSRTPRDKDAADRLVAHVERLNEIARRANEVVRAHDSFRSYDHLATALDDLRSALRAGAPTPEHQPTTV